MPFKPALEMIDALSVYFMRRTSFVDFDTLTIDQDGNVTYNIRQCYYLTRDRLTHVYAELAITSAGNANNAITISGIPGAIQPAGAEDFRHVIGTGYWNDPGGSPSHFFGALVAVDGNTWRMIRDGGSEFFGVDPNLALGNGDYLVLNARFKR